MIDLRKAAEMALEALEKYSGVDQRACDAEEALQQALAQPKQEPVLAGSLSVRYFRGDKAMTDTYFEYLGDLSEGDYTLYTAPPNIEAAVLAEREACAEICDGISEWYETRTDLNKTQKQVGQLAAEVCGVRIRERKHD